MNLAARKLFLEVYGIFRIFIGVGQLVALCGGYFMTEFIVRYPKSAPVNVMNEEMLALAYLVIILRGIFHTFAGISLARLKPWGRMWLFGGWPVVVLATFGFVYSLWRDLTVEGYTGGILSVIAWEKVLIYMAFIIFDFTFVARTIVVVNTDQPTIDHILSLRKLTFVFFVTVLSFILFIFLGRPIREGFHAGFYKRSVRSSASGTATHVLDFTGTPSETSNIVLNPPSASSANVNIRGVVSLKSMNVEPSSDKREAPKFVQDTERTKGESGMAYGTMIGLGGGFFIVVAFLFYIMETSRAQNLTSSSLFFHGCVGLGFFLWGIYGMSIKLWPLAVMSSIAFILNMYIVVMAAQNINASK